MQYTYDDEHSASLPGYSVVVRAFSGRYDAIERASREAFGRTGLDTFTLAFDHEGLHLPAEIAAGMAEQEALEVAQTLIAAGALVEIFTGADVEALNVKHRAWEVWPTRAANGWHFTEVGTMIFTLAPLNARENVRRLREADPDLPNWQTERALNHQHPTQEYNREALRAARELGETLAIALREAYPDRRFVLDYQEEQVSFYQRGRGAPEANVPPEEPLPHEAHCDRCGAARAFRLREMTDAEFPLADWGECVACGLEILLRTGEVRVIVGQGTT